MFREIFDRPNKYDKCGAISVMAALKLQYIRNFAAQNFIPRDIIDVITELCAIITVNDLIAAYESYVLDFIGANFNMNAMLLIAHEDISRQISDLWENYYKIIDGVKIHYRGMPRKILYIGINNQVKIDTRFWSKILTIIAMARPKIMFDNNADVYINFVNWPI